MMSDRCVLIGPGGVRCERKPCHDEPSCRGRNTAGDYVEWPPERVQGAFTPEVEALCDEYGNPQWVEAADYYKVVGQRDNFVRAMGFIAAQAWAEAPDVRAIRRLLTKQGFDKAMAESIQSVIEWALSEDRP